MESTESESTSVEEGNWRDQWKDLWLQKKLEAINSTLPPKDVNMVAARPWGVSCGDPDQIDVPWGTCMLPLECEPEYRIYRGDFFCGHTQYVCCALQLTNYDLYGGFDPSLENTELEVDTYEETYKTIKTGLSMEKKKERLQRKRRKERLLRKRRIEHAIKKIEKEVHHILMNHFRNTTKDRKYKTTQLKKFIRLLKDKYLHDRDLVRDVQRQEFIDLDKQLQKKLMEMLNCHYKKKPEEQDSSTKAPPALRTREKKKKKSTRTTKNVTVNEPLNQVTTKVRRRRRKHRRSDARKPDYVEFDMEYGILYE